MNINKFGSGEKWSRYNAASLKHAESLRYQVNPGTRALLLVNWLAEFISLVVIGVILYCLVVRPDLLVQFLTLGGVYH